MSKKEEPVSNDVLIADALLRLRAIENLLIAKGLFTKEEFFDEMEKITRQIAKDLLQKARVSGDLEAILDEITANNKGN